VEVPFTIAPHSSFDLECRVKLGEAGRFSGIIHVYADDLGLREFEVRLGGVAK
jgi:hypothetical protein